MEVELDEVVDSNVAPTKSTSRSGPGNSTMNALLDEIEGGPSEPRKAAADQPHGEEPENAEERLAQEARQLARACESELSTTTDPRRAARLHFEIGRLNESPLRDLRRAVAHYQESFSRSPEHLPTIRGLRRVLFARKAYQAAVPLFDAEARVSADPHRKAALMLQKGRLLEDVLGNRQEARLAYGAAAELDRTDASILKAIEQVELDTESWTELRKTLERTANAVEKDERYRSALVLSRAKLVEARLTDPDAAIELYEMALKLDPKCVEALSALKRLHHGQRRWRDLIRVLAHEAELTTDPEVAALAFYRVGRLHAEQLGNQAEAILAFERALAKAPRDMLVLGELARLYEGCDRFDALADTLAKLVGAASEPAERLALLHKLGTVFEEKLGDDETARTHYEAALTVSATHLPVLQALEKVYVRHGLWEPLVKMHIEEADATDDPPRRAAALARVAETCEIHLGRPEDAIDHHGRALGQVPQYAPSFKALVRLLTTSARYRELIELYERAVDQGRGTDRAVTYLMKIGALYEDALQEPVLAATAYRRVLEMDGSHLGAIHALQRATERAGRFAEYVEALELEAEKTSDPGQVVALVHQAGEVLDERMGDRDGALLRFRRVLGLNPKYVPALVGLGRIYYRSGRWEDLLELYKRELELTPKGAPTVALLHKMAELCEQRIGRDDEALGYYRKAVEHDPAHAPSLRALAEKHRARGEWAELVRVLDLELGTVRELPSRARQLFRIGEVHESLLGQPDKAIAAYEQALKAAPDFRPAIDALTRLRAERKTWSKLVDDLEREATGSSDPRLGLSALMRQGEIWAAALGEPRRAIQCYERVLEQDSEHLPALVGLEPLYRRVGNWPALANVFRVMSRVVSDPQARIAALREVARLEEGKSLPDADPLNSYEKILELAPEDPAVLEAVERIALERTDRLLLGRVDARMALGSEDSGVRAVYQTRLAESLEVAGDPRAIDAYRAALESDPESLGATRGLSRLAERFGDPIALAEAARREAAIARDSKAAARLFVRSAQVRSERLGDTEGAIADLERALEIHPDHDEAADRLTAILVAGSDHQRLVGLLSRAAGSAESPERQAALWTQVASLQAKSLGNLAAAIGALNRILRVSPNHVTTLRGLADLFEKDGQWTEAVNLLKRVVQLAPEREVLRGAHLTLAMLWDERLGESSRALVSLQAVLALDPKNQAALERLGDIQERDEKTDQAAETASRLIDAAETGEARANALHRLGRLEKKRGHEPLWLKCLLESVALAGAESEAAYELRGGLQTPSQWERYTEALGRYLQRASERGEDTTPVYLELARVRFEELRQPEATIEMLQRGLSAQPQAQSLRLELGRRLRMQNRFVEAITELQGVIHQNVCRTDSWRELGQLFESIQRPAEARLCYGVLSVFGTATEAERDALGRFPPQPAHARPLGLDADVLRRLDAPGTDPAPLALLGELGPSLGRLYPPDLDAYGLSARDRVTTRQGNPLRNVADRLLSIFGVAELELYVHRTRSRGVAIELTTPPALLVPGSIADLPASRQVFVLGRPIASMARNLHAVHKLTPRELEVLFAAVTRNVSPGFGAGLTSEDILEDTQKRIFKALSRKARKAVDETLVRVAAASKLDFPKWVDAIQRTARRAALLCADDLPACIEIVKSEAGELQGLSMVEIVKYSPAIEDMLRFWISDIALRTRRHAGLLPPWPAEA